MARIERSAEMLYSTVDTKSGKTVDQSAVDTSKQSRQRTRPVMAELQATTGFLVVATCHDTITRLYSIGIPAKQPSGSHRNP
jgi:hypothetical protein